MNDRVYPSARPAANGADAPPSANGGANPASKTQLHKATRPTYRPQPTPRRGYRRSCCRSSCLWTSLVILVLILLLAIAGVLFYVLYRPHRPSFSVNSLQLSKFKLTDTSLASSFNFSITARNPNKKVTFFYDQIEVKILSGDLDIADGSFPGFTHGRKNVTTLRTVASSSSNQFPAGTDISPLKSSLKSKNLPLKIQLDTKMKVKIGKMKTKVVGIRVICDGINISIPSRKTATAATTSNVKCKFDPRIKIIKWTF